MWRSSLRLVFYRDKNKYKWLEEPLGRQLIFASGSVLSTQLLGFICCCCCISELDLQPRGHRGQSQANKACYQNSNISMLCASLTCLKVAPCRVSVIIFATPCYSFPLNFKLSLFNVLNDITFFLI